LTARPAVDAARHYALEHAAQDVAFTEACRRGVGSSLVAAGSLERFKQNPSRIFMRKELFPDDSGPCGIIAALVR
jgi:hypothetical protein